MHLAETTPPHPPASLDHIALKNMGQRLVEACPDMLEMARGIAKDILHKRAGSYIEPDHVYWHRFETSVSSPRTFNGWQHYDPPIESMTLPELVMRRFHTQDQDNVLDLQVIGGFYTAGPTAKVFNETNEVRLLPADVLSDLWQVDFSTRYTARLSAFWQDCADDFRTMAKGNFIARALEERDNGWLSDDNFQTVIKSVCGDVSWPVSLDALTAETQPAEGLRICTFDIAGHVSSNILRIVDQDGRQLLYVPGEIDAFHVFETHDDLHWWVLSQTSRAPKRAAFMAHFPLSTHVQNDAVGLNHMLDLVFSTWGAPGPSLINQSDQTISGDAFTWMRDTAKTRMSADAYLSLHSNADLRKQMWIGYLNSFSRVAGGLAALDWPVALVAVGAGLSNTGLNIDQAVNGHTTAERKAGVIGAILSGVDALFNSLFLIGAGGASAEGEEALEGVAPKEGGESIEPVEPSSIVPDLEAIAPGPVYAVESNNLLAPFETNVLLDGFTPMTEGRMRGIYLLDKAETYISMNDFAYAVRYVNEMKTWVIIDPENPFSFYRNLPVRLNAFGEWEPIVAKGLKGGGKMLGKMPWGRSTAAASAAETPVSPYDVPVEMQQKLRSAAEDVRVSDAVSGNHAMPGDEWNAPYIKLRAIRERLFQDATAFYEHPELPPRPEIPELDPTAKSKDFLKKIFNNTSGLVVGESHSSIGSKQLLIENMPQLAKLKVKTLYMEHLLTDFHQADLDVFARTGKMSENLERYLNTLDAGHSTDPSGQYTFLALVKTANENHIRVRAIDCMASYRLAGMRDPDGTLRQRMMNFFARTVIRADQTAQGAGKWVALVGNSHANTFNGVPGVSELENAIGLRIEDVGMGQSKGIDIDPGAHLTNGIGKESGFVKSDLRLQMETVQGASSTPTETLENRLPRAGMFTLDKSNGQYTLIHRSGDNSIVRTLVNTDRGHVYINRPSWRYVSGRRFDSVGELINALTLMGMKHV